MILQRYILRDLAITFALSFLAVVSVCALGIIFQTYRAYEGVTLSYIGLLAPAALAQMAPWAMIVAACLSTTLVYGRLAAENEIDAVRTSGIPVIRVLTPAILFGLILTGLAWLLISEVAPRARFARRSLVRETLLLVLRHPPSGRKDGLKIGKQNRLSYVDCSNGTLRQPALVILNGGYPYLLCFANEGRLNASDDAPPSITFQHCSLFEFTEPASSGPTQGFHQIGGECRFEQNYTINFVLDDLYRRKQTDEDMPTYELDLLRREFVHDQKSEADGHCRRCETDTETHGRLSRTLAIFLLVLLSAPLAIFLRKGNRLAGMGTALPPLITYIVFMILGEGAAAKSCVDTILGAYGADFLVGAAALVLLYRVGRA